MADIQLFDFHGNDVRITDQEGNLWFVFTDLCAILGYSDPSRTLNMIREKYRSNIELGPHAPNAIIINEAGMNQLIMRSNKPEAEALQDWVYEDVLPTIRRTGKYDVAESEHPMVAQAKANLQLTERFVQVERELAKATADRARIEGKADMLLAENRMTIEEFVTKNGLLRQFPENTWNAGAKWLGRFCGEHGLEIIKIPVAGKSWPEENAYPCQALMAWQRHAARVKSQRHLREV